MHKLYICINNIKIRSLARETPLLHSILSVKLAIFYQFYCKLFNCEPPGIIGSQVAYRFDKLLPSPTIRESFDLVGN